MSSPPPIPSGVYRLDDTTLRCEAKEGVFRLMGTIFLVIGLIWASAGPLIVFGMGTSPVMLVQSTGGVIFLVVATFMLRASWARTIDFRVDPARGDSDGEVVSTARRGCGCLAAPRVVRRPLSGYVRTVVVPTNVRINNENVYNIGLVFSQPAQRTGAASAPVTGAAPASLFSQIPTKSDAQLAGPDATSEVKPLIVAVHVRASVRDATLREWSAFMNWMVGAVRAQQTEGGGGRGASNTEGRDFAVDVRVSAEGEEGTTGGEPSAPPAYSQF